MRSNCSASERTREKRMRLMSSFLSTKPNSAMMRNVIIVSPHFPPSTLAGVHRARHLAKHLPAHGWRPTIIRVDDRFYTERPDPALASLVPGSVEQVKVSAISAGVTRLAAIGDVGLRSYRQLGRAIERVAAQTKPEAILITGSPFYPMLLSGWIKRKLGIPVVLDFQDPWVSAQGATRPKLSKGGMAHRLAVACEPRAVRHAAFVTSVSETQNAQMADLYPWLDRSRMAAIPIGGDPEDFDALRSHPVPNPQVRLNSELVNLSYVGSFLPRAEPLVRLLFQAVYALRLSQPKLAARLRLNFVGTSNQPDYAGAGLVHPLAADAGIADLVNEFPRRVSYLEALSLVANSSGLLLIGSDEPHYTASKIYPALMSGRPYLSLFHAASGAHRLLSAAGGGQAFCFSSPAELAALAPAVSKAVVQLAETPESFGRADAAIYNSCSAASVAGLFAEVFDRASLQHRAAA